MHLARGPRCSQSSSPSATSKKSCRNFTAGYQRCSSRSPLPPRSSSPTTAARTPPAGCSKRSTTATPVAVVDLSRNFGKEIALTAGLDHARGDAIVVIDADLQDPPELIPELVKHWREGYDAVYATRTAREGETALNKLTARLF